MDSRLRQMLLAMLEHDLRAVDCAEARGLSMAGALYGPEAFGQIRRWWERTWHAWALIARWADEGCWLRSE